MDLRYRFDEDSLIREDLRKPFPPEQIGRIPASKGRPALDFVGHAAVTDRLNKVCPNWTYTVDERGPGGEGVQVIGTMTIGGVSRVETGDGTSLKEAIGNFIRRGAMRFGVAIDLWTKEELGNTAPTGASGAGRAGRSDGEAGRPAPNVPEAGGVAAQPASGANVGVADEGKNDTAVSTRATKTTSAAPAKRTGGGESTSLGPPTPGTHTHDFSIQSPTMKDWEVCSCGKAQKKEDAK